LKLFDGETDVSYRTLDAAQIVDTLRVLEQRVRERFPDSGLAGVCHELVGIAETTQSRSEEIAKPNRALRATIFAAIAAGLAGLIYVAVSINVPVGNAEIFGIFQGLESAMNIVVLVGAALFFLISLRSASSGTGRCATSTNFVPLPMSSTCIN
jgi:hypothetical protein